MSRTGRALFILAAIIPVALIAVGCDNEVPDMADRPSPAPAGNDTPEPAWRDASAQSAPMPTAEPTPAPTVDTTGEAFTTPEPPATVAPTAEPSPEVAVVNEPDPPVAGKRPHSFTHHGITIEDPWNWLRDADYPTVDDADVLAYLVAENEFFEAKMSSHQELIDTIFEEIKARQQPDLSSVPWRSGDWYYQWSYEEGSQYRVWQRWPADDPDAREAPTANAQRILDEPELAKDLEYFRLGSLSVSNDGSLAAYSTDTDGSERYRMAVKNLEIGEILPDEIEGTTQRAVWAADDASFFYTVLDDNWRPWQVRRHVLGAPVDQDSVVYEEPDPGFFVGISLTGSKEYIVIGAGDHVTSEVRLVPASDPGATPVLVSPRRTGHEYSLDHQGDRFVIRTNDTHKNSRLATAPDDDPTEKSWSPLVDASDSHYIRGFEVFQDFIAVEERIDGLDHVRLIDRPGESSYVPFPESAYTAYISTNREFETDTLRLGYTSMVTPSTVFDYHLGTDELEVRQVQQVPSGYDASEYVTDRRWPRRGTVCRFRCRSSAGRIPRWTAPPRFTFTATARTATPFRRRFPPRGCPCWTAASSSPLRTFAAATIWDTTGTRPASWTGAPTHSTTSWTSPVIS